MSTRKIVALGAALVALSVACAPAQAEDRLRLGYMPNITHATAIAGLEQGMFRRHLEGIRLDVQTYNAGPEIAMALFSGALDAAYVGPNPAINAYIRSQGAAVRVVAGATSGGAFLVTRPDVGGPRDLRGATLATPQIGNTQDVALRSWLAHHNLETTPVGGGDVSITPAPNSQILQTFRAGGIDGAWVPEPWASRMLLEAGGKVLVDERDLWPDGRFVTTHLVVRTEFLERHPDLVRRLLEAHVEADRLVREDEEAMHVVNAGLEAILGRGLPEEVLASAWASLEFTVDPMASSLERSAEDAVELGFLGSADLEGIHDLVLLNDLLASEGRSPVEGL